MGRCLILGGNGFIGSHLAESLVQAGHEVSVFDNFKYGSSNLASILDQINLIKGDFSCESDLREATKGQDYVFHYISTTNPATAVSDPIFDIQSNIVNSVMLLKTASDAGVKKVIFSSSGGTIYGEPRSVKCKETDPAEPINPYAISKLAIEKYLHYYHYAYGLDYSILRYSNPYGERQNPLSKQGVIPIFLNRIKHGEKPIIYGDGHSIRDYIYIQDAIDATLAVMNKNVRDKLFNIGYGEGISLLQLIETMSEVVGKEIKPEFVPTSGVYISRIVLDISRIKEVTGWKPRILLSEGIDKTWAWINRL